MYKVIAYYNFQKVENPKWFCADHRRKCTSLSLMGRVYVSKEGVNGTLSGSDNDIESYKEFLRAIPGFEDTEFKSHDTESNVFPDLRVKVRPEIVALKKKIHHDPKTEGGKFLTPKQWREVLESGEDYVMIDVRNDYETKIGHFEGAVCPPVENFYDFPNWLELANIDKSRKILMYCTGGIRCEKFSVYMQEKGYEDVNQLRGGILKYAEDEKGAHYRGKCFVFDDRLTVPVNKEKKDPISKCEITGVPCDTYINCANMVCNKLFICSREGAVKMEGCCSEECRKNPERRPFNADELYIPFRRWYKYFDDGDRENKVLKEVYIRKE